MKKKIGIITILSYNLGNRLQNYALQEYLTSHNYEVRTIPVNIFKMKIKKCLSHIILKYKIWEEFNKSIKWDKYSVKNNKKLLVKKYDYFIAGSDQIWNPLFSFNSEREFLTFAKKEQRIAYAASVGISELPIEYEKKYADMLKGFSNISVREDDAAKMIKKLINKDVPVVLDPTMLLTSEKWKKVAQKSKVYIEYKYILSYFLGIRNDAYDRYIKQQAEKLGVKVLDITEYNKKNNNIIGPTEFTYLIFNSEGVFTDSFHGTVFSILFQKNFVVFDRPAQKDTGNMSCRLDTLLKKFDIENRRVVNESQLKEIREKVDYVKINKILDNERKIAGEYLQKALT